MYLQTNTVVPLLLFAAPSVLGHVDRATSCAGVLQAGYCCDGSIFKKDHSNDISPANLICCDGDPHLQINTGPNAPTSCTAGSEIPLTKVSGGGSTQSTASTGDSSSGAESSSTDSSSAGLAATTSANNAVQALLTDTPMMAAAAILGGVALGL